MLVCLALMSSLQAQIDFSVKPKGVVKGLSSKGLSAEAASLVAEMKSGKASQKELKERYSLMNCNGQLYVQAIIKLADGVDKEDLSVYGVVCNSSTGDMATAMIPVDRIESLAASGLCKHIDVSFRGKPLLENTREHLGIDRIHSGIDLPQGYDGTGVVVGMIDHGFDYTNPTFLSADGSELRIRRVWEQTNDSGTPPAGMSYGTELATAEAIMAKSYDVELIGHGTITSSIAAGRGVPSDTGIKCKGIAPGADIVLVSVQGTEASFFDAISYIQSYARSVSKPCVINISIGTGLGSHDGNGMIEDYFTSYMNENNDSLVVVVAAGNNGDRKRHLSKTFSLSDTLLCSRIDGVIMGVEAVDLWCDRDFEVGLALVNTNTGQTVDFTGFYSSGSDTAIGATLRIGGSTMINWGFYLQGLCPNNKYNATAMFENENTLPDSIGFFFVARCRENASMHVWSTAQDFVSSSVVPGSVDGDGQYTIEGIGATSDAVISVGSYVSSGTWVSINGGIQISESLTEGGISNFSATGPTADNRIKPDIAAPGETIIVPTSKYSFFQSLADSTLWNGQTEWFEGTKGTSLAAPMVTGIVALWLQHNPSLGIAEARNLIHNNARRDVFTGDEPNNHWGWGKINAFAGLPQTTAPMYLLTAIGSPCQNGFITGGGTLPAGEHILTAVPRAASRFVEWSDGVTDNPRTVTLTSDTVFTAVFEPLSFDDCDTVAEFPWNMVWDNTFSCWLRYDENGDDAGWTIMGAGKLSSGDMTSLNASIDDWIITKPINITQPLDLVCSMLPLYISGSADFSILISTDGYEKDDFSVLRTESLTTGSLVTLTTSLNDYMGQVVRIAFRHHSLTPFMGSLIMSSASIVQGVSIVTVDEVTYSVATRGLQLSVSGAADHPLKVYDISGRLMVDAPHADGTWTMPAQGVYILRVGNAPAKKVVLIR